MPTPFDRGGRPDSSSFPAPVSADTRPSGLTYEPFYGLREKPFSLTSDSRFFYQSRSHAPAFDDLLNAIRRRESLNVLTGDIGTGKTTLCRTVLQSLDRKTFSAFVPDPFASREELLKVLLTDFGVASIDDVTSGRLREATRTELSYLLYEFLGTLAPLQAFAVAVIDEAQNLSQQLLEEVRILSDADGQLQVILVGQLELRDRLKQADMRQLDQRVSVHCRLQPLDLAGVAGYISHRLHVAGGSSDRVRFTGEAVEAIYLLSGGIPRIINRLCDRALRYGYSKREAEIDADIVQSANPESSERETPAASSFLPLVPPVAAASVVPASSASVPVAPPAAVAVTPPAAVPVTPPPPATVTLPAAPVVARQSPPAPVVAPVAASLPPQAPPRMIAPLPEPAAVDPAPPVAASAEPTGDAGVLIFPPESSMPQLAASPSARSVDAPPLSPQLSSDLETWLERIEREPAPPPVLPDWRQRWVATNAVATPTPERRSGVRVKIPSVTNPQQYTHVDRIRRRWTRRFFATAVTLILLLGALVVGPAAIAASLDILSQIDEQFTAPPAPPVPPRPTPLVVAAPRVTPPADPLAIER